MPSCSHAEEMEDPRETLASGDRAEDDLEVTNFYVNPIAKPIPQGRLQACLQDTITELNMHKVSRNGLEVSKSLNLINELYLNVGTQQCVSGSGFCLKLFFPATPQLSSDDVSASLGEESLQEDREEEPQETHQAPHPAGESFAIDFRLQVLSFVISTDLVFGLQGLF